MTLNKLPSFQEVKDWTNSNISEVPSGGIMMNTNDGGSIPPGFVLCDGNNGTPDLRGKYVKGASGTGDEGTTGGSNTITLSESEMPSHDHKIDISDINSDSDHSGRDNASAGGGQHQIDHSYGSGSAGGDGAHPNEPEYMELRYMMKT